MEFDFADLGLLGKLLEHRRTAVELERKAAELRIPDPIPSAVGETGNWTRR